MEKYIEINNPIGGCYRPGLYNLDRLIYTSTGHERIVNDVLEHLREQTTQKKRTHLVITGPDGLGKTHLLKILTHQVNQSEELSSAYLPVIFPVDNYTVQSTVKLMLELVWLLGETTKDTYFSDLKNELNQIDDDTSLILRAGEKITAYAKKHQCIILVIYDNINQFVNITSKRLELEKEFENVLSELNETVFVSSYNSKRYTETTGLPRNKQFRTIPIPKLNVDQTIELIKKNLEWEGYATLLRDFDLLIPKIKALHHMSGGSPRLLMLLYTLVINESKIDIKKLFEQLLDQVSPFFYNRLNRLNQYEKALISAIARSRSGLVSQSHLGHELRITPQQCSAALGKLAHYDLIEIQENPDDKRSKLYRIKEGFFDLWLAIGQSREPKNFLPLLGEFIQNWYSEKQNREIKRQQIWEALNQKESTPFTSDKENNEILLETLSELGQPSEVVQSALELAVYFSDQHKPVKAGAYLKKAKELNGSSRFTEWVTEQVGLHLSDELSLSIKTQLSQIFTLWSYRRINAMEDFINLAILTSDFFVARQLYTENIYFLEEIIDIDEMTRGQLSLKANIAVSYEKIGQSKKAIDSWLSLANEAETSNDLRTKSTAYNNISQIYQDLDNFYKALEYLEMSLEISNKINDTNGQSTTLNNIATIHFSREYYEKALEYLKISLSIVQASGNISIEAITLSNMALIYQVRGDFEKALDYLEQSLVLMRKLNNVEGESTALLNLSQIYYEMDNKEFAYDTLVIALTLSNESMNYAESAHILMKMVNLCVSMDNRDLAYTHWKQSENLVREYGLKKHLPELSQLAKRLGIGEKS